MRWSTRPRIAASEIEWSMWDMSRAQRGTILERSRPRRMHARGVSIADMMGALRADGRMCGVRRSRGHKSAQWWVLSGASDFHADPRWRWRARGPVAARDGVQSIDFSHLMFSDVGARGANSTQ